MKKWLVIFAWLFMSQANSQPVEVFGIGNTFDEAKQSAFKVAIEFVSGSIVVANRQVLDNNLKQEILDYSAGYVENYKILSTKHEVGKIIVNMQVWVKSSLLADRILGSGSNPKEIDGRMHQTQLSSFLESKAAGDKLLQTILDDFPKKAMVVAQGNHTIQVDNNRNFYLSMPLEIKWNPNYLLSFNEAVLLFTDNNNYAGRPVVESLVQYPNQFVTLFYKKSTDQFFWQKTQIKIPDSVTYNLIRNHFAKNLPQVLVEIKNRQHQVVYKTCFEPESHQTKNSFYFANDNFVIHGDRVERSWLRLKLDYNLQQHLSNFYNIETKIVSEQECF